MTEQRIPPGYYAGDSAAAELGARKILASVDAGVARLRAEKWAESPVRIEIEAPAEGIRLSDEGLPGFSLENLEGLGAILNGEL